MSPWGRHDACVLGVPAEYAGPSSGSGHHPQQYSECLHQFCMGAVQGAFTTLEEKRFSGLFLPVFGTQNIFVPRLRVMYLTPKDEMNESWYQRT